MKIYQYDGGLYCAPCGEAIAATLPEPDAWEREHPDTCSYPVAYDSSEGESDSPDHCLKCGLFLECSLSEEGIKYVREAVAEDLSTDAAIVGIVREWADFYGIEIGDCVDEDVRYWRETRGLPAIAEEVA